MIGPTFYKVHEIGFGFLAVMAKPTAGEWIDDEFSGLRVKNIGQVVSLLEPAEAREVGLENEATICQTWGLSFVSLRFLIAAFLRPFVSTRL